MSAPEAKVDERKTLLAKAGQCPVCEGPRTSGCRCFRGDSRCEKGHEWHWCIQHLDTLVIGPSDHKSNACTCWRAAVSEERVKYQPKTEEEIVRWAWEQWDPAVALPALTPPQFAEMNRIIAEAMHLAVGDTLIAQSRARKG